MRFKLPRSWSNHVANKWTQQFRGEPELTFIVSRWSPVSPATNFPRGCWAIIPRTFISARFSVYCKMTFRAVSKRRIRLPGSTGTGARPGRTKATQRRPPAEGRFLWRTHELCSLNIAFGLTRTLRVSRFVWINIYFAKVFGTYIRIFG